MDGSNVSIVGVEGIVDTDEDGIPDYLDDDDDNDGIPDYLDEDADGNGILDRYLLLYIYASSRIKSRLQHKNRFYSIVFHNGIAL